MMWFLEGGPSVYAILGTDVLLIGVGALVFLLAVAARFVPGLLLPARILALLLLLATVVPVFEGAVGWWFGMQNMRRALEVVDPEMRDSMETAGSAYARIPLWFGLGSTVVLGAGALFTLVVAALPHHGSDEA